MVRCDGRDAAPVVDAGVEQAREVVGEVRGRLHVDVIRKYEARRRDGPKLLLAGARGSGAHDGAVLGAEVLDDHLLYMTVAAVARGDRLQGDEAVGAAFTDAHQDPGGERNLKLTSRLQRGQPSFGCLVGRPDVALEIRIQ